jgi:hypothetical protein
VVGVRRRWSQEFAEAMVGQRAIAVSAARRSNAVKGSVFVYWKLLPQPNG